MKQLEFWNNFYDPFEIGWYIQFAFENRIAENPNVNHRLYSEKTHTYLMGYIVQDNKGVVMTHFVRDDLYLNGHLLHVKNFHK
jgi:hypothetical protein